MPTYSKLMRCALYALAATSLATAAADAKDHRNCNELLKVKRYHECMEVYQKCMRSHSEYADRMACVDAFIDKIVPPSICKGDEFYEQCKVVRRVKDDCYKLGRGAESRARGNGSTQSFRSVSAIERFGARIKDHEAAVPAITAIRGKFTECLGRAAYKKHNTRCGGSIRVETLDWCGVARDQLQSQWQDYVKNLDAQLIAPALKAAGGKKGAAVISQTEKLLAAIKNAFQEPRLAVPGVDVDALAKKMRADHDEAVAKAQAERAAREDEEAQQTAKRLPKAKMKNGKLAKQVRALIERKWDKDEFKRVILSSKKWQTKYVYIGRFRTNRVSHRVLPMHVITRPENGRHCRLFEIGAQQDRVDRQWRALDIGWVGSSKWTKCP